MERVVAYMAKFAREAAYDLDVRGKVEEICASLSQGDYCGEILACYYWCCQNIRYMKDPVGVELVKTPAATIRTRAGDCDDIATLLAGMLLCLGNGRVRFKLVGFQRGGAPTHVYVEAGTPSGWITLDPVANRDSGEMLTRIRTMGSVDVAGRSGGEDAFEGMGASPAAPGGARAQVYSVYDYRTGLYRYYAAPLGNVPASGYYRKARGPLAEHIAEKLPMAAQQIGEGPTAQGLVATATDRPGGIGLSPTTIAVVIGAGVVGWWWWHRRRRHARRRR